MNLPEIPQHAADAAGRAYHSTFGAVIAVAAALATVAVLAFTEPAETRAPATLIPPAAAPDASSACEPDGTFCEPDYLLPPTERGTSGRLPESLLSGSTTPAG